MNSPGAILLVACYELGHQPLAVAWPAAFLEREGYLPAVMDLSVEPFDEAKVRRAQVILVSVPMHTALRLGVGVVRRARALNPGAHIALYGLYASLNADYLLAHGADAVLGGEAEAALVDLVRALQAGDGHTVAGVARAGHPAGPNLVKLPFPVPSRAQLPPLEKYAHLERDGQRHLVGYVEASRGCRHLCRHCPIPPVYGGRFFVVPRQVVLADVRQAVAAGATHVTFGDPDFLNGPGHALAVARALHAEFPALTFDCTAKVEHLLRDACHLPELARLGCLFVVSAVESLSDTVLAALAKGHTRADVLQAVAAVRAAGITLRPTWVPFTPWTMLGDYRDMLDFIAGERLIDAVDPVQYSIRLLVPPGSLLLASDAMRPYLGGLVAEDFYHRWTHPDPRMERLADEVAALVARDTEAEED
ncbi:MAG: CUAEP/CCAEP-tail radical SAM (seleno)protein, partial [Candidatus Rokuibacteriota bacterium]